MPFRLPERLVSTKLFLDRIAASSLLAKADTSLHKARFAKPFELAGLIGSSSAEGLGLLLGVGPYGRLLPSARQQRGGNSETSWSSRRRGEARASCGLAALTWPYSAIVNDIKGELFELTAGYRPGWGRSLCFDPRGLGHRLTRSATAMTRTICAPWQSISAQIASGARSVHQTGVKMLTAIFRAGVLKGERFCPTPLICSTSAPNSPPSGLRPALRAARLAPRPKPRNAAPGPPTRRRRFLRSVSAVLLVDLDRRYRRDDHRERSPARAAPILRPRISSAAKP